MAVMVPCGGGAGALHEVGQQAEDGRRVTLGGRRFACSEADFALGHGDARQAIEQEEDIAAFGAEGLGDGRCGARGAEPHGGGVVAGGSDDDAAPERIEPEVVLDEIAHFASALADEGDDRDSSAAVPRASIPSRVLLPTPEPAKIPTRCPRPSVRKPSIARTPVGSGSAMGVAVERVRRLGVAGDPADAVWRLSAVDRTAKAVEHPPEECHARPARRESGPPR